MKLLQELNQLNEATRRVPAGTFTKKDDKGSDQETYFGKNGELFDPANPYHADEKKRREKEAKERKAYIKNMKATDFPKLPGGEDGVRLFDKDLVNYLRDEEHGKAYWDKLSELEQIEHQLDFVSDPRAPAFRGEDGKPSVKKYNDWLSKTAKKLQDQIKVPKKD